MVDIRLGAVTWLAAAAREVPQKLGDLGILVHSGWNRRSALLCNYLSALSFLVGGVVAYALSGTLYVAFLVPFAAGNFIHIVAADLLPQITAGQPCEDPTDGRLAIRDKIETRLWRRARAPTPVNAAHLIRRGCSSNPRPRTPGSLQGSLGLRDGRSFHRRPIYSPSAQAVQEHVGGLSVGGAMLTQEASFGERVQPD